MTTSVPSVFLVEAAHPIRNLVAEFLRRSGQVRVVGTAVDSHDAAPELVIVRPDVVVVDRVPAPNDGWRQALDAGVRGGVLLHTTTVPRQSAEELAAVGIVAVVFKEVGKLDELVATVRRMARS